MLVFFAKLLHQNRGIATTELLVLTGGIGLLTVMVLKVVMPALAAAHDTVLSRITNIAGSGY
ncbi:hypothetical protein SAMN00808754_1521 [Thermanaeromonas toyohensis ToBE]|uniref:Uncharacterized protein n=1 Tax=Thermanaeromonas toyohensis ToBE TaxID=698762 RepID=A0A1W1VT61_9FIRM|nr:hypothetical protein [Thermanaeromonas toyohensis]SMB96516.1 hypothetical protein SAMN00808754_1521 [Thermanaeromonas toyohensis ToBE]